MRMKYLPENNKGATPDEYKNYTVAEMCLFPQVLFPLFSQLDYPVTGDPEPSKTSTGSNMVVDANNMVANVNVVAAAVNGVKKDPVLCSALMQFICELVEGSTSIQQQVFLIASN